MSPGRTWTTGSGPPNGTTGGVGGLAQAASQLAMAIIDVLRHDGSCRTRLSTVFQEKTTMYLLLLEALGALLLLVFIVWWTMFSGRKKGELKEEQVQRKADTKEETK